MFKKCKKKTGKASKKPKKDKKANVQKADACRCKC